MSVPNEELERAHAETAMLKKKLAEMERNQKKKLAEMERNQKSMQRDIMKQQEELNDRNEFCAKDQVNILAKQKETTQLSQKRSKKKVNKILGAM